MAVVLVALDQRRLSEEAASVTGCQEQGRQAAVLADNRLDRTATYLSPARVPDASLARTLLSEAAVAAREPVAEARRACVRVEVRRWHPTTRRRRDNVVDYLSAQLASLEDIAADGTRYYGEQPGTAHLRRLRTRAFPGAP